MFHVAKAVLRKVVLTCMGCPFFRVLFAQGFLRAESAGCHLFRLFHYSGHVKLRHNKRVATCTFTFPLLALKAHKRVIFFYVVFFRVVLFLGGLFSGWSFFQGDLFQAGLFSGWSFFRVIFFLGWSFPRCSFFIFLFQGGSFSGW